MAVNANELLGYLHDVDNLPHYLLRLTSVTPSGDGRYAVTAHIHPGVLELTDAEHELKRVAVGCFASQIRPLSSHPADAAVLPPFVIDRLLTRREMVFR